MASPDKKDWATIDDEETQLEEAAVKKDLDNKVDQAAEALSKMETPSKAPESKDQEAALRVAPNISELNKGVRIIVEQDDPNSPLHSVQEFKDLNLAPELLKGVYEMGFNRPSKIQESALPAILKNPSCNLIAQAQSGTGKTAAFVLGMLSRSDPAVKSPQAICICPTRELAIQIADIVKKMGQFSQIQVEIVVKEKALPPRINAQIIVGTSGKILDMMKRRALNMSKVKIIVLDEADEMITQQSEQSRKIKNGISHKDFQTCLFSATFPDHVVKFADTFVGHGSTKNTVRIRVEKKQLTLDAIQQLYIDCETEAKKFEVLSEIYENISVGQSIVFAHTRKTVNTLHQKMTENGFTVSMLHGEQSPDERDRCMKDFKDGKTRVLLSTNVLSRGIDVLAVMLVINYDLPLDRSNKPDPQTYLHRIGRSGRFGRKGIAINFVHDGETMRVVKTFEHYYSRPIKEFKRADIDQLGEMLEAAIDEDQRNALSQNN